MAAVAAAITIMASPALAGGGSRPQAHGAQVYQPQVHPRWQPGHSSREPVQRDARAVQGQAHTSTGGPRLEQRPDPNNQNPYRPMYSLDATPPGQTHPYFQTRKDGFGYPASRPVEVYLGNGVYFIPR
jgi:hypothetical protein